MFTDLYSTDIRGLRLDQASHFFKAESFPTVNPIHWLVSHFAVGGYSQLRRLSGMITAHMTQIAPRNGFTWHPHRGLEIYTYVIDGELYHEDTTGGRGIIRAGEVQRMFSGDYIAHQELNLSNAYTRVIQIWFAADPSARGLPPHYEQVALGDMPTATIGDATVRSIIGPAGATDSHVNARLTATTVPAGGQTTVVLPAADEDLFLYFVDGQGTLDGPNGRHALDRYDVLMATAASAAHTLRAADAPLTFLSFYLPPFMRHAAPLWMQGG